MHVGVGRTQLALVLDGPRREVGTGGERAGGTRLFEHGEQDVSVALARVET
ncbi:MAG: hypothetical protein OXI22_05645 [Defluviicoccus sp.]|nr:hypothetical protein [Defluviicoccus sp.]MDE0383348.1 hypothetical protein [Defluviicoccus sp.]